MAAGQRYGRLTALEFDRRSNKGNVYWRFVCDCGAEKISYVYHVQTGKIQSCGCFRTETTVARSVTHGMSRVGRRAPEYHSWAMAYQRCTNQNSQDFKDYGGRGIKFSERWKSFANFYADMGPRPPGTTLDRFPDGDGNYEPGNCRWATDQQQARNRRSNHIVVIQGQQMTIAEAAERLGESYDQTYRRLIPDPRRKSRGSTSSG